MKKLKNNKLNKIENVVHNEEIEKVIKNVKLHI